MTYGELLSKLYELSPTQLQQSVTVVDDSEGMYDIVTSYKVAKEDNLLMLIYNKK